MKPVFRAAAACAVWRPSASILAQAPGIQRTVVYKADVSVPGREAVIARVELAPGASAGRHTHFGDEITYVMEGEAEIIIEGQPNRKVKAGDGFVIPAGKIHDAHNTGSVASQARRRLRRRQRQTAGHAGQVIESYARALFFIALAAASTAAGALRLGWRLYQGPGAPRPSRIPAGMREMPWPEPRWRRSRSSLTGADFMKNWNGKIGRRFI